jgi:hypothetical protein
MPNHNAAVVEPALLILIALIRCERGEDQPKA